MSIRNITSTDCEEGLGETEMASAGPDIIKVRPEPEEFGGKSPVQCTCTTVVMQVASCLSYLFYYIHWYQVYSNSAKACMKISRQMFV